jgi:hypothetical protein
LAAKSEVFLHIAKRMVLSFKNVHSKYEILGVPILNSQNEIVNIRSGCSKDHVELVELIKLIVWRHSLSVLLYSCHVFLK